MSGSQPLIRKRNASAASMNPPDNQSTTKRTKLDAALETRLTELKQALHPHELRVEWGLYDPGIFMKGMDQLGSRINALASKTTLDKWTDIARETRAEMMKYVTRVRNCLIALRDQANVKPAPNEFADSKQWGLYQERSDAILCLRPAKKGGLPITLMHPAFCNFARHFHEPPLDNYTPNYISMADKLCEVMPSAFDSENDRRDAFEKVFVSLEFSLSKTINYEGGHLILLLEEFKMESTEDIYMQICRSYEVLCGEAKNERLLKFGNPVFLLCVLGPYLMVCGAIKHENAHVEPLTPLLPMFPGFGIAGRPVQIAHCLRALKLGLDVLQEFWQDVGIIESTNKKATTYNLPEPYLVSDCPDNGLLRFEDWQGTFESPMPDGNKHPTNKPPKFFANLHKAADERQVVVKFVYNYSGTYGTAVHKYLHGLGLAPTLYLAKKLHLGLDMVIMERLTFEEGTGGWIELDTFEGKLGAREDAVRKKLEKIIECLQEKKMVHVDLRPTNIMIKVDENGNMTMIEDEPILSVIDFDWAGELDEVRYPPFLNPRIPWPTEARAYQKVGENDDRILLDNWWDAFVKGQPAK